MGDGYETASIVVHHTDLTRLDMLQNAVVIFIAMHVLSFDTSSYTTQRFLI